MTSTSKKLFNDIKSIVNAYDPYHLIEGGAPEDEYDSYVPGVISLFINNKISDPKKAGVTLHDYFVGKFGPDAELGDEKYLEFGNALVDRMRQELNDPGHKLSSL